MIKIENLVKRYGQFLAIDHLNLEIKEGEIFGLLGPNGSGKTTTINCILSLLKYDKGTIEVMGKKMTPESYLIKSQIGVVMQNVAVFEQMSVQENIDFFCGLYIKDKHTRKQYVEEAIDFVGLQDFTKMKPKQLSGGLLRRLNIACGIVHKPKLIFMDEPTVAVDPQSRNSILEGIVRLNEQGATIVYTSHYMEEVEQICSRIAIMDHGQCIAQGTKESLKAMIKTGEKVVLEGIILTEDQLQRIRNMPHVFEVKWGDNTLEVSYDTSENNILELLTYFRTQKITFGKVYALLPTLNDVFLELTGKALRD